MEKHLLAAAEIFIYLTNCPDENLTVWQELYVDLLRNFSPRMIIQHIFNINQKTAEEGGIEYEVTEELLRKIDSIVPLRHRVAEALSLPHFELKKSKELESFYQGTVTCMTNITENVNKSCHVYEDDRNSLGYVWLFLII